MDDFNNTMKRMIRGEDEFKKYAAALCNSSLNKIEKLLDAKVERCHVYNSDNRDEIYNKITITYKDDMK